jgi:hypothetical protein
MTTALDPVLQMDQKLQAADAEVGRTVAVLRDAQSVRSLLENRRRKASGRLASGDANAIADLAAIYEEMIRARKDGQEAERGVAEARDRIIPLQKDASRVEQRVMAEHLSRLLDVRTALAALFEAQVRELAATSMLFRQTVKESVRLAGLMNAPTSQHLNLHVDVIAARRLLAVLRSELAPEFQSLRVTEEDPLPQQDTEGTGHLRRLVDQISATPSVA